ncbi:MAG: UbiA family prenyltransferase [Bacteroidia bacterium]
MAAALNRWRNALILMRIPFSIFLMPVYWFALSNTIQPNFMKSIAVFIILHLFAYPASNGYNSWYDRDTGSIGGLKSPPTVNIKLFWLVLLFDVLAIVLSLLLVSITFALMVFVYLFISKAYSYDKIRLKKFPWLGALVVTVFQGAFIYLAVKSGVTEQILSIDLYYALVGTLFLAGSYPLTQIYQHEEDKKRGDNTLSIELGINGTFTFATVFIAAGSVLLLVLYFFEERYISMIIFPIATLPVLIYFNKWKKKVWENAAEANFDNTMKMNKISSLSLSAAFILIFLLMNIKLFF